MIIILTNSIIIIINIIIFIIIVIKLRTFVFIKIVIKILKCRRNPNSNLSLLRHKEWTLSLQFLF